jgi:hypothetical protein
MKLCPPASSSDVELARAIAQRLSQPPAPEAASDAPGYLSFTRDPTPPVERGRQADPAAPETGLPEAGAEELPDVEVDAPDAELPDISPEPLAEPAPAAEPEPFGVLEAFAAPEPFAEPEPFAQREPASPDEPSPFEPEPFAEVEPSADPLADLPGEAPVPALPTDDPLAGLTAPGAPEAVSEEFDPLAALAESPEVLPSWSEILETCRRLAEARGAMLVGPDGMVVESQGEWPQAGAQAVADKLGPIVDKKHQASPGAAVSLRLGPSILTAWKVQIGNAEPIAAFVADRAVAPVVRPEIEEQLRRGELD